MLITEMIAQLEALKAEHGNLEIYHWGEFSLEKMPESKKVFGVRENDFKNKYVMWY